MQSVFSSNPHAICRRSITPLLVLVAISIAPEPASARQKKPGINQITCGCTCMTPGFLEPVEYKTSGSCGGLNNKTCNVEDPQGNIRTGKLASCSQAANQPPEILRRGG